MISRSLPWISSGYHPEPVWAQNTISPQINWNIDTKWVVLSVKWPYLERRLRYHLQSIYILPRPLPIYGIDRLCVIYWYSSTSNTSNFHPWIQVTSHQWLHERKQAQSLTRIWWPVFGAHPFDTVTNHQEAFCVCMCVLCVRWYVWIMCVCVCLSVCLSACPVCVCTYVLVVCWVCLCVLVCRLPSILFVWPLECPRMFATAVWGM